MTDQSLRELERVFSLPFSLEAYGNGHINDTYITGGSPRYVVQKINRRVFRDPVGVMQNFESVTEHLRSRIREEGGDPQRETLTLRRALDGKNHAVVEGEFYRVYRLVEGAVCYESAASAEQFCEAGRAFGRFQRLLRDFPADRLCETIPRFHDTPHRYEQLLNAVREDVAGRLGEVGAELAFVKERVSLMDAITKSIADGSVPLRVTHNDTKINNVLFDADTGRGLCVIDLDTVMPGSVLFDFGDAIRAGATTGKEDERDLSLVCFDLDYYRAFRKGFLEELGRYLAPKELELLPLSAILMTLECGMRFLADHLNGDVYFRIQREGQNLDRARTQFKLVADMEKALPLMNQ